MKQVAQWKTIFFTLPRNKTCLKFTNTLNEILSATLNDSNAETAMHCAMVTPHLNLARTRTEDDVSNSKTIARTLLQWVKWEKHSLFLEAKAIQARLSRTKSKRSVEYKEFEEYMSPKKTFNAIRSLTEKAKSCVPF